MKIIRIITLGFLIFTALIFLSFTGCKPKDKTALDTGIIEGEVVKVKVVDGDTYDLQTSDQTIRVKMERIDAPEKGMHFYKESKKYLHDLCFGQIVAFKPNRIYVFEWRTGVKS